MPRSSSLIQWAQPEKKPKPDSKQSPNLRIKEWTHPEFSMLISYTGNKNNQPQKALKYYQEKAFSHLQLNTNIKIVSDKMSFSTPWINNCISFKLQSKMRMCPNYSKGHQKSLIPFLYPIFYLNKLQCMRTWEIQRLACKQTWVTSLTSPQAVETHILADQWNLYEIKIFDLQNAEFFGPKPIKNLTMCLPVFKAHESRADPDLGSQWATANGGVLIFLHRKEDGNEELSWGIQQLNWQNNILSAQILFQTNWTVQHSPLRLEDPKHLQLMCCKHWVPVLGWNI